MLLTFLQVYLLSELSIPLENTTGNYEGSAVLTFKACNWEIPGMNLGQGFSCLPCPFRSTL
jgi:hypothetical protein